MDIYNTNNCDIVFKNNATNKCVTDAKSYSGNCFLTNNDVAGIKSVSDIISDAVHAAYNATYKKAYEYNRVPELSTISCEANNTVVVRWTDDTVTVVRCSPADTPDIYSAYCAALAKKIHGTTSAVYREIDKHNVATINARKAAELDKKRKENEAREKINHERKIRRIAKRLMNENEALAYIENKKKQQNN